MKKDNKKEMRVDDSLLKLERKLEHNTPKELILNNLKFSKPEINQSCFNKDLLKNMDEFLSNFKKSNEELLNNKDLIQKANIENKSKGDKYIEMKLGLGVLEVKDKQDNKDEILFNSNQVDEELNQTEELMNKHLIKFLFNKSMRKRRRIRFRNKNKK